MDAEGVIIVWLVGLAFLPAAIRLRRRTGAGLGMTVLLVWIGGAAAIGFFLTQRRPAIVSEAEIVHRPIQSPKTNYVSSQTCRSCHLDHHESWERTYHRTMTQRPTPDAVVGEFDGREVTYEGQAARVFREGDRFFFDVPDGDGRRTAEVRLAVGSHRYQQYFEREQHDEGWSFKRLPFLWHIGERR